MSQGKMNTPRQVLFASLVGTTVEFFDFYIYATAAVLVFTWGIALSLNAHHGLGAIGRRSWIFLVLSGLCTGLSWLCYFRALQLGPVSGVAPIDKLSVALVILAGWLFFGESMTPAKIVGGALVTVGALVIAFA